MTWRYYSSYYRKRTGKTRVWVTHKPKSKKYKVKRYRQRHKVRREIPEKAPMPSMKKIISERAKPFKIDAKDYFDKTRKLNRVEKFEDLLETSTKTRSINKRNFEWWKKDIKKRDLINVDTENIPKAQSLSGEIERKGIVTKEHLRKATIFIEEDPLLRKRKDRFELRQIIAEIISKGEDPMTIDFASLGEDKPLREALRSEMEFELIE